MFTFSNTQFISMARQYFNVDQSLHCEIELDDHPHLIRFVWTDDQGQVMDIQECKRQVLADCLFTDPDINDWAEFDTVIQWADWLELKETNGRDTHISYELFDSIDRYMRGAY